MAQLPQLNDTEISYFDEFYRLRLQALAAVDEMVANVINRLTQLNLLKNTFVIYTSDNGYHMANHRLQPGKTCAYEEDINIPFYIRGPGVPKGKVVDFVTTHTDIVPTLFDLAGIPLRDDFDGSPMPITAEAISKAESDPKRDHTIVEFWGKGEFEGKYGSQGINGSYSKSSYLARPDSVILKASTLLPVVFG